VKRRRTTALSVSAAALLAAAPLLTGCSTGSHPGAAAVVGGERISLAEVQSQVETVRDAQLDQPNGDDLVAASSGLTRETVNFLVYLEVVERTADEHGVSVSRREVQQARTQAERSAGGAAALRTNALMPAQGMPLAGDQIDAVLASNLQIQGLAQAIGAGPDTEGQRRLGQALAETAEDIGVEVNPRFGEWDARAVSLTETNLPWLRVTDQAQDQPA
jgi:hypothetical protein